MVNVVKPGIKSLATAREKEINKQRRMELEALQMKLSFYLKKVRNSIENEVEFMQMVAKYEDAKRNLLNFYQGLIKLIGSIPSAESSCQISVHSDGKWQSY